MANLPQMRTSGIKGGITIDYSDLKFYWNALHGKAYRYWWSSIVRIPVNNAAYEARFIKRRR